MTREEQMHGKCLKDSIRIFLKTTRAGPVYVCSLCHQTHFVDNVQDIVSLQPGSDRTTLDSCLTRYKSICNKEWICMTCKRDIYNDLVPKLSVANNIGFPECPLELELYPLEETLVAPLLPFMTIHSLPVCGHTANGQKLIVGNVVHVPSDIVFTVNDLPHTLDEMGTVPIELKKKKSFKTRVFQENVCPVHVMNALEYLLKNSKRYQLYNISLLTTTWLENIRNSNDQNRFFVEGHIPLISNDVLENSTSESNSDNSTFEEIPQAELNKGNLDTMLTEHIPLSTVLLEDSSHQFSCDSTPLPNNEVYTLAPGEGKIPVFKEPHAEYLCFPQFSLDKNNHQTVNASRRYMHVISLRLSYIMWTLMYLLIFQIYFGRKNICKYSKLQIK